MTERRPSAEEKRAVARRARGCCEYCRSQLRFAMQPFSVERIEPRSREGETALDNLAFSCQGCNGHKYTKTEGRDPVTGQLVPLYHPRRQRWSDHFAWREECTIIVGLTPTGRATVEALHLNRSGVVNLRRALYAVGEHPPPEPGEVSASNGRAGT
jgi:5-methylcytosine-specific restriction endonuclease McrA